MYIMYKTSISDGIPYLLLKPKRRVPAPVPKIGPTVFGDGKTPVEHGRVKHRRVLQLTLLASTLLPINFVLKLDILFTIRMYVEGRIFQTANIVPKHKLAGSKSSTCMLKVYNYYIK